MELNIKTLWGTNRFFIRINLDNTKLTNNIYMCKGIRHDVPKP